MMQIGDDYQTIDYEKHEKWLKQNEKEHKDNE